MKHIKKILKPYFEAVVAGTKTFEIRNEDDCRYNVGDTIELVEVVKIEVSLGRPEGTVDTHAVMPNGIITTGRKHVVKVTYRLDSKDFPEGIKDGYVILGIKEVKDTTSKSVYDVLHEYVTEQEQIAHDTLGSINYRTTESSIAETLQEIMEEVTADIMTEMSMTMEDDFH